MEEANEVNVCYIIDAHRIGVLRINENDNLYARQNGHCRSTEVQGYRSKGLSKTLGPQNNRNRCLAENTSRHGNTQSKTKNKQQNEWNKLLSVEYLMIV